MLPWLLLRVPRAPLRRHRACPLPLASSPLALSPNSITLRGCRGNNLKGVDVSFPLGQMIAVTGVSGSGKSTLINQTLYPILSQHFYRSLQEPLAYDSIEGIEHIDKVIGVDQSPIGRTPRSNPATYTGVFTDIRNLFAQLPESKIRSWKAGRFSFNNSGGRCEECKGDGTITIEMQFMADITIPCESCHGERFKRDVLDIEYRGKNINDILNMTVNQAIEFFSEGKGSTERKIVNRLRPLQDVGLGYIKLGQSSSTLSGGENQRVKLAYFLSMNETISKGKPQRILFIFDEPTTGLHFYDVEKLLKSFDALLAKGHTIVVVEHNPDVIRSADWLIDLGPEAGDAGGNLVFAGKPEELSACKESHTADYITL